MSVLHCAAALGGASISQHVLQQLDGALPAHPDPRVLLKV